MRLILGNMLCLTVILLYCIVHAAALAISVVLIKYTIGKTFEFSEIVNSTTVKDFEIPPEALPQMTKLSIKWNKISHVQN